MMKLLKQKHSGDMAVESVILTPLMFISYLILLYFFFMCLTYISYNNVANKIASQLNMRQTGYSRAARTNTTAPKIMTYRFQTGNDQMSTSSYLDTNAIKGYSVGYSNSGVENNSYDDYLTKGLYGAAGNISGQFLIPFNQVTGIYAYSQKPISLNMGSHMAGNILKVKVSYKTMVFGSVKDSKGLVSLPELSALGYAFIS